MFGRLRLLSAFQAIEFMQNNGVEKAYGVNRKQALAVLAEFGIEIAPHEDVSGNSLEEYMLSVGYEFV